MKKLCLLAVVLLISLTTVFAQKGQKSVGVSLGYGSEMETLKLGVNFKYNFSDQFRVAPSFDYYLKKNGASFWGVNADANYLFNVGNGINVYPLAGLALIGVSIDGYYETGKYTDTEFGANLGGGLDFGLSSAIDLNVEAKYQILDNWNQFVVSAGISFKF